MKPYDIASLAPMLRSGGAPVVLFGAGRWGGLVLHALRQFNVDVRCFCDSDMNKQETEFCGLEVISPETLATMPTDTHVFISCNYIVPVLSATKGMNFENVYNCVDLLEKAHFVEGDDDLALSAITVMIERHRAACMVLDAAEDPVLTVRGMDLMVTEGCTMRCKDCSNLMQYYDKPRNEDPDVLFRAFDTLSRVVDRFLEVRMIGGEPFLNKRLYEIINTVAGYAHVEKIAVFTNATIIPKADTLEALKHPKVYLDITNYGPDLSKNHDKIIPILDEHKVVYTTHHPHTWTDSAKIEYREKSEAELELMFSRCCVNDVLTLLHGKLYRCPFSANAMNLGAIPRVARDVIDLTQENPDLGEIRKQVRDLYTARKYISACSFCNGRDYTVAKVEPGLQTKTVLPFTSYLPIIQ